MGVWGIGAFDNDEACDWAAELEEVTDLSLITESLETILATTEYLEAPESQRAIAAAEVLARLNGNWGERTPYTEICDAWVELNPLGPDRNLAETAKKAIDRIMASPSELLEIWGEAAEFNLWKEQINSLRARLKPGSTPRDTG